MRRMFQRAALVCVALVSLSPAVAAAQTADEIVAKNLEAKGGIERLRSTTTVRLTGTMTLPSGKATMVTLSKRPNLFRREMDVSGQKMVQAFDGSTLWMRSGTLVPQEMPPGPQAEAMKRSVDFDSPFLDWAQKGHKLESRGKVTEGGKELHHLVFVAKDGPAIDYYIDPTTGLETKTVTVDPATKARMELRMTDYRNVEGRMIPFVMTQVVDGKQLAQIRLDRIEFNVPIDDALFRMPK